MSGFDDNPFADPSVQKAAKSLGGDKAYLEDYNPFDPAQQGVVPSGNSAVNLGSPAVMDPTLESSAQRPPPYSQSGQQQVSAADFERRQEELERRARELEQREEEIKNSQYPRQNNWPPLPSFCPFQPCFYQDINLDIPVDFQKIVRNMYYLWVSHVALLFANMMVGLLYLFVGGDKGQTFGLALVYWALFTPASYICWFRPAYKAFRDDSSFNFMVFFFVFFFQFLFSILYALGIGGMGSCGIILAIGEMSSGTGSEIFVGVCMLLVGFGFSLLALCDFYLLMRIHKMYRSTGASMAKAQAEFTSGVMRNEQVQAAAAAAAGQAARNQFGGGSGSTGQTSRY